MATQEVTARMGRVTGIAQAFFDLMVEQVGLRDAKTIDEAKRKRRSSSTAQAKLRLSQGKICARTIGMIICHSRKFIFIHIHKTGGTSVEKALEPILNWRDLIITDLEGPIHREPIFPLFARRFSLEKHSSISDVERECGSEILSEYYVFATVRHPLDRVCSVYNFVGALIYNWARRNSIDDAEISARALTDEARQKAPVLRWPASIAFLSTDSFSAFIRDSWLFEDRAFQTQVSQLCNKDGTSVLTSAFRIEDQSQWIPAVSDRIKFQISLPRLNVSPSKLITARTVSADDRTYIEKRFHEDYKRFGY